MDFFSLVVCGILLLPGIARACPTSLEGWTFQFSPGKDAFLTGISSAGMCKEECIKSETCKGYTYEVSPPLNFCYLFSDVSTLTYCEGDCYSATVTKVVSNSSCPNNNEDVIDSIETKSSAECLSLCENDSRCQYFIWLDEHSIFPNTCILSKSVCEGYTPCANCQTGSLQCIYPTPPQCSNYLVLNDETRSMKNKADGLLFCDSTGDLHGGSKSPDWQGGDKWYRIMPPAGLVIPEIIPRPNDCGTDAGGWLNGRHPEHAGSTLNSAVCFSWIGSPWYNPCVNYINISVTNCGGFYIYKLPNIPYCRERYCAVDHL